MYKGSDPVVENFEIKAVYYENYFNDEITHGYQVLYKGYEASTSFVPKSYLNVSNDDHDQNGFALQFVVNQSIFTNRALYKKFFGIAEAVGLIAVFFILMILPMKYLKSLFDTKYYENVEIPMEEIKNDSDGIIHIITEDPQ